MLSDANEITRVLRKNRKRLECSEFMFAEDSNLGMYCGEKVKVLVLFLSNGKFRSSSNTFNSLYAIGRESGVFMDYCYMPDSRDSVVLKELGIPFIRGSRSGLLVKDFDIVLVSVAVLKEIVNLPVIYQNDGIPFGIKGRAEEEYPLFVMGGSSASVLSIACGDFYVNGVRDRSLVDLVNYGKGEKSLPELFQKVEEMTGKGISDRELLYDRLSNRFLIPSRLDFEYDVHGVIVGEKSNQVVLLDVGEKVDTNFNFKILNLDGSYSNRGDLLISSGCSGRGSCSFCLEGSVGGCWKEKGLGELERDIFELKSNSWCESVGIFSYNSNYHTNIYQIAEMTKTYFDRSSLLASRADVYANEPEFIELCRSLGSIKLGIAAEGVSSRIRNDFLNKRLSRDEYYKAVENIMGEKILTLKINYILTGKELDEDFEELLEDMKHFVSERDNGGYSTRIQLTITNLEIYDMTSLKYEERVMAKESYHYEESEFIKKFLFYIDRIRELGIGIKLYGVGGVSAFDQLILDLGFMGTSILVNSVVQDGLFYDKEITRNMSDDFFKRVSFTYNIEKMFDEREETHWFPSSLITYPQKSFSRGVKESYKDHSCESCINPSKSGSKLS